MAPSKLSLLKVWILLPALIAGLWSLSSCQIQKKPSFLIIAIDHLSFNSFTCGEDKQNLNSGLGLLCKEAIRFTHAYTTSTQSAAAMGSVLTGVYPLQHKLHRSFDRIDSNIKMLQDIALEDNYQTYFFSGGPTILKKTGLSAGFDVFDDFTFIEKKSYFLDFKIQTEKFFNLVSDNNQPFLSVIYNSELESLNEGESQISSLEKLDEKIFKFFIDLKNKKMWDETYIIVVGLQGKSDYSRFDETVFSNLNSENTRVNLFIKPPRSKGDEGIFWKVDSAISLADLGKSLIASLKKSPTSALTENTISTEFPILDISSVWENQNKNFTVNSRKILIEAADTWTNLPSIRLAILFKNLLFINDDKPDVYNTLTDGLESINIASQQKEFILECSANVTSLQQQFSINLWTNFKNDMQNIVQSNREYWSKPNSRNIILEAEYERIKKEKTTQPLSVFLAKNLLKNNRTNDFQLIKKIDAYQNDSNEKNNALNTEIIKQKSLNLALENIWGLWQPDKKWLQSNFILDNQ